MLYRSGIVTSWLTEDQLHDKEIVQIGKGKGGTDHLQVTNMRTIGSELAASIPELAKANRELCVEHLAPTSERPSR